MRVIGFIEKYQYQAIGRFLPVTTLLALGRTRPDDQKRSAHFRQWIPSVYAAKREPAPYLS
ncbi:hypothetical protein PS865_02586 [Pseudomonas fluorescens]|nr:hypothetical protein PS865_02586 [Pseudomonas fluorescens]